MARADLLVDLVRFGVTGNRARFKTAAEAIIAEERAKSHTVLAGKLEGLLHSAAAERPMTNGAAVLEQKVSNLLLEVVPERSFEQLILPEKVLQISRELVEEHHRLDLLRSYNLEPRNRVLLIGPPGNGKTSLAEAFAGALMVPLLVVRYEGVVGAYLGETAARLRRILEYAGARRCVLFFDEFETLGKERGDRQETGEIKRVVSSLLMQIDSLPSHTMVIGATNHPELLDRAAWRRFQVRMMLPAPTRETLAEWFVQFEKRIKAPLGYAPQTLARKLQGASFAEAEEFGLSIFRRYVLEQPGSDMKRITARTLNSWKDRSARTGQPEEVRH